MRQRLIVAIGCVLCSTVLLIESCKDMGNSSTQTPPPAGGSLSASQQSVTVSSGGAVNVTISGGTVPYHIDQYPDNSLATAAFQDSSVTPATLVITGVSTASVSGATSVKVKDSSPSPEKAVEINITKVP